MTGKDRVRAEKAMDGVVNSIRAINHMDWMRT